MTSNALRWDGREGWYEVWYIVVAGRFWIRYTFHVPADPAEDGTAALWLASWAGAPAAWRWTSPLETFRAEAGGTRIEIGNASLDAAGARGAPADGFGWELRFAGGGRAFEHAHRLVRPVTRTRVIVAAPALDVSGWVEVEGTRHHLEHAPGHQAHVFGSRHATGFAWAHASVAGGRWVELLAAQLGRLPQLAAYATEQGRVNAPWRVPFVRAKVMPERACIGPYQVTAAREDFVGVTYHDPDGKPLYCYHTERARLEGPGLQARDASYEFATRTPLADWPLAL